uniref:Reverse transcriptase Ty1/copia-type domain-containing protein n=1 Tax=Tanacetum cinerariifolium TaxID=118510 RepID=A0A699JQR2_TANCI|nr:hypothetical protein [Tanacetum cinerariifolium]
MDNSKRVHIPIQESLDLNKTQGASTPKEVKRMQNVPYVSAVGSIMYAVRCTRPDVAFAQNITSLDWKSSKKSTTAMSATEAEYIAASEAAMEAVWIRKFILVLDIASGSNVTFLILYVDDIIIMGNHIPSLQSVNDYLGKCFAMKDLGEVEFILGIKIYRDRSKRLIRHGQNAYMDKILKRYKMDNSKRGHIPMQERLDLNKTQVASTPKGVKRTQNVPYALVVGSIINTKAMFLVYNGNSEAELRVDCYCDAGFETDRDDIKSQTGYVFLLNGGAVD